MQANSENSENSQPTNCIKIRLYCKIVGKEYRFGTGGKGISLCDFVFCFLLGLFGVSFA